MDKEIIRVLVIGSSGLIGKELIKLKGDGVAFTAPSSDECNLFDSKSIKNVIKKNRFDVLVHLAWKTNGDYITSSDNQLFLEGSKHLFEIFEAEGGKRIISLGTCLEYELKEDKLTESSVISPQNAYAEAKVKTSDYLRELCVNNSEMTYAWARVFYAYGKGEKKGRLIRGMIDAFSKNQIFEVNHGQLVRDYIYAKDIAKMIRRMIDSSFSGSINFCTGEGISLEDYCRSLARAFGKENLIRIQKKDTDQVISIIGDNSLCRKVCRVENVSLEAACREIALFEQYAHKRS